MAKLNPERVAQPLVKTNASVGNVRILRSFISQIVERAASFDGALGRFHNKFAEEFSVQWERNRDVRYPELRKFPAEKYQEIFRALESGEIYWQQAMAIRLYFAFHAPLSRVLAGQRKQICGKYWYPYWPDERQYWFECREEIKEDVQELLTKIGHLGTKHLKGSDLWFPSRHPRRFNHIRTVEYAWQRALRKSQVRYYPLREFSRSYREFNNPSTPFS